MKITAIFLTLLFTSPAICAEKPNIVLILADDIGLGDISYYHQKRTGKPAVVPTPNLDKLLKEGMRFSNAHSPASLCAPTRFSMLTGNYPFRNPHSNWGVWASHRDTGIDPKFTTTARIAKKASYRTAFIGKWGLGGQMYQKGTEKIFKGWGKDNIDYSRRAKGPNDYGFDYSCELPQGIQNIPFAYYENQKWMPLKDDSKLKKITPVRTMYNVSRKHNDLSGLGDSNWDPRLAGSILTSKAVQFLDDHQIAHSDKPFFLYYCSQAVHIPHTPPKELNGVKIAGSTPGVHGDMVRELDVQIGILREALEKNGQANNTLLIFTSDNGGLKPDPAMIKEGHDSSNGLRAFKGSIHEGGHRVPFLASWPGKIKPNTESDEFIVGLDVIATLSAICESPVDRKKIKDSLNLLPLLQSKAGAKGHPHILSQSKTKTHAIYAIQEGPWKLIMKADNLKTLKGLTPIALFNLEKNPTENEEQNLIRSKEQADLIQRLLKKSQNLRKPKQ